MIAFLSSLLFIVFVLTVILMIPVVLMQSGSGAQAGLFGSDFASGAFGGKTSEVLVRFTKWLVAIFFMSSLALTYLHLPRQAGVRPVAQPTEAAADPQEALPMEMPLQTPQP